MTVTAVGGGLKAGDFLGTDSLRSTVREAPVLYGRFSDSIFFRFQKFFCRFLGKINSDIFYESKKFQVKKLVGRKNFKKKISEQKIF